MEGQTEGAVVEWEDQEDRIVAVVEEDPSLNVASKEWRYRCIREGRKVCNSGHISDRKQERLWLLDA